MNGRSDKEDWSHASESLFRSSRADHDATSADRARVRRVLARRLAGGAARTTGAGARAASRSGFHSTWIGKGLMVALGVACVAAGAFVFTRDDRHAARSTATTSIASAQTDSAGRTADPLEPGQTEMAAARGGVPSVPATNAPSRAAVRRPRTDTVTVRSRASKSDDGQRSEATPTALHSGAAKTAMSTGEDRARSDLEASPAASSSRESVAEAPSAEATNRATTQSTPDATRGEELDDLRAELALVKHIHFAMQSGKPLDALTLCAEHARRWPHGTFVQEREGVRAIASCETRSNAAGPRARAFLANYPRAPLAPRVATACSSVLGAPAESAAASGVH